jgi:hypothetical protein
LTQLNVRRAFPWKNYILRKHAQAAMRSNSPLDYSSPRPGTPEATEMGCTCRVVGHDAKLEESAPSALWAAPDPNCPVHGPAAQLEEHD